MLQAFDVTWVNTVGMRRPRLSREDVGKAIALARRWAARAALHERPHAARSLLSVDVGPPTTPAPRGQTLTTRTAPDHATATATATATAASERGASEAPAGPRVLNPIMYPGFRAPWQRRFNRRRLAQAVRRAIADDPRPPGPLASPARAGGSVGDAVGLGMKPIVLTTLPITADLVGELDAARWVYYAVDDFSVWPGLDGRVMYEMERELARRVDACVAVSETIAQRLIRLGADPNELTRLTHGIDPATWRGAAASEAPAAEANPLDPITDRRVAGAARPVALFWGVIDRRLDAEWCVRLADAGVTLLLAGPEQQPDSAVTVHASIHRLGPQPYAALPELARRADVLVMPYVDRPVTRAMQPLKLKEYLATRRPVVVRDLPATRPWSDCCDVVADAGAFVSRTLAACDTGLSRAVLARRAERLAHETWDRKAERLARILLAEPRRADRTGASRSAA